MLISGAGAVVGMIPFHFGVHSFGCRFLGKEIFEIGHLSTSGLTYDAVWPAPEFREPVLFITYRYPVKNESNESNV